MTLQSTEAECAANATAPRVSLADIEGAIAEHYHFTADRAVAYTGAGPSPSPSPTLRLLSICILVMNNGFAVVGKSAPASPANFNAELGKKLAYEDCIRQLWPLMGFALREQLARKKQNHV